MSADPFVRIAEIEVDPDHLDDYRALLAKVTRDSVAREPGVLMLHALALAERPHVFRVIEVYESRSAYESHLMQPHFLAHKTAVAGMVRSLTLHDAGWAALNPAPQAGPKA